MTTLPEYIHESTLRTRLVLFGLMLVLWAAEVGVTFYCRQQHHVVVDTVTRTVIEDGVEQEVEVSLSSYPTWVYWAGYVFPLTLLAGVLALKWVPRADIGLTVGNSRATIRWTFLVLLIWLLEQPLRALTARGSIMVRTSLTTDLVHRLDDLWTELLVSCVLVVLVEEIMLRSIPARVFHCKRNPAVTILICFFVWTLYHVFHERPAGWTPFYMISGGVLTWVFLKTGSLIPSAVYHAWNNFFVILKDVLVLQYPDLVRPLLPQQSA